MYFERVCYRQPNLDSLSRLCKDEILETVQLWQPSQGSSPFISEHAHFTNGQRCSAAAASHDGPAVPAFYSGRTATAEAHVQSSRLPLQPLQDAPHSTRSTSEGSRTAAANTRTTLARSRGLAVVPHKPRP